MRLIDADYLKEFIAGSDFFDDVTVNDIFEYIHDTPTVNPKTALKSYDEALRKNNLWVYIEVGGMTEKIEPGVLDNHLGCSYTCDISDAAFSAYQIARDYNKDPEKGEDDGN